MTINCKKPIEISNLHSLESALSGVIKTLKFNPKSLRAAPHNYQIDMEIVKKRPGHKLSQNKVYRLCLQNSLFKSAWLNSNLLPNFFLPYAKNGQKSAKVKAIFSCSYIKTGKGL